MRKKLTHNLGLKIISALLALLLWLVVVNINNPVQTKTISNVQVVVKNESAITDKGKVYEIKDGSNNISVVVKAPRSVLENLRSTDLQAVADLEEITDWDTVDIQVTSSRFADEIEELTPRTKTLKVSIEDSAAKQFAINVVTSGTPGEGYAVGETTCTPNIVRIAGPASVVNQISKVVADVNVDGMTSMIKTYSGLKYYDNNGDLVKSSSLEYSVEQVFTTVTMLKTKQIQLQFIVKGTPADGYQYTGVESVPDTITVAGTSGNLAALDTIKLTKEPLDISNATGNVQKVIDISKYLPKEIKLADDSKASILVTANVEKLITKNFTIPYKNLEIKNLGTDDTVVFDSVSSDFVVSIKGVEQEVNKTSLDSLKISLDLNGLGVGSHNVRLSITLPDHTTLESDRTVALTIKTKEEAAASLSY